MMIEYLFYYINAIFNELLLEEGMHMSQEYPQMLLPVSEWNDYCHTMARFAVRRPPSSAFHQFRMLFLQLGQGRHIECHRNTTNWNKENIEINESSNQNVSLWKAMCSPECSDINHISKFKDSSFNNLFRVKATCKFL